MVPRLPPCGQSVPDRRPAGRGPAVVSAGADPGQQPAAGLVSIVAAVLVAAAVIAAGTLASAAVYPPGTVTLPTRGAAAFGLGDAVAALTAAVLAVAPGPAPATTAARPPLGV